jgi:CubicO group peptidase (beta-lactamase class C family)
MLKEWGKFMDRKADEYAEILFLNEQKNSNVYTKKLKHLEDYRNLLTPVWEIYSKYKEIEIGYCYDLIYKASQLESNIKKMVCDNKYVPGLVLEFGTKYYKNVIVAGNQQECNADGLDVEPMSKESVFDLASVSKFFTCLCVLKQVEEGRLELKKSIYEIDNRFTFLKNITVEDLLSFKVALRTDERLDKAVNTDKARQLLFEVKPDYTVTRLYSDMGAMVLKCVLEKTTGSNMWDLVDNYILKPCNMKHTYIKIPQKQMKNVVSNNFERRIINGEYRIISDIEKGLVSDEKSRNLNKNSVEMYGHAGIFSTADDIHLLIKEFLGGNIINKNLMDEIGKNRTGKKIENGFSQFLGYLCYSKNPIEMESEVNHFLSGNAFALGGYTGNQLTVDINNNLYIFLASNRCHNRVTQIVPERDSTFYFSSEMDGISYVNWNDGNKYIYTKEYAYDRGPLIINPAIELAIQYSALEYFCEQDGKFMSEGCRVIEL